MRIQQALSNVLTCLERSEQQRTDRFAVDEKIDATITQFDKKNRSLTLSIKAREIEEERKAMADFGSSDSGASLGDILGGTGQKKKMVIAKNKLSAIC